MHRRAALVGYSAGSTGEPLWRDTRRDPLASRSGGTLASCSGGILGGSCSGGIFGGIHWASSSGGLLGGIHWQAALARYSAGSTGGGIHWRAALAGYSAGSTGEPLWRDTRRDPLASRSGGTLASCSGGILGGSCSGGIFGGIHWASRSGGLLGGIHWQAALAGYSAGSTGGGIHWRAALAGYWVGAWCRSIANVDSNMKSNNPFLSGGEKQQQKNGTRADPQK